MWFFTPDGFYSAVIWDRGKNKGKIVVRAREAGVLEMLRSDYMPTLGEVSVSASSDYRYRAFIEREDFAEGMKQIALDVDYPNFKSEAAKRRGFGGYEKALHEVWSVMARLQPRGPYGMGGAGYPKVPKGERATPQRGGTQGRLLL